MIFRMRLSELRSEVRRILSEDDGGGFGDFGSFMPTSGMGYGFFNYGKEGDIMNIFVKPFVDVFDTARAETAKLAARTKVAAKTIVEAALSSAIPFFVTHYRAIFDEQKKQLEALERKYKDVYEANAAAFRNKDALWLSFMYDPSAWITAKTIESSPRVVVGVLETLTPGAEGMATYLMSVLHYAREIWLELQEVPYYKRHLASRLRRQSPKYAFDNPFESVDRDSDSLREERDEGRERVAQLEAKMMRMVNDPRFAREISALPKVREMKNDAKKLLSSFTGALSKDISNVASMRSLSDVSRATGGKVHPASGSDPQAEEMAVQQIKAGLGKFYRTSLEGALSEVTSQGVPEGNAYVRSLRALLSKVPT